MQKRFPVRSRLVLAALVALATVAPVARAGDIHLVQQFEIYQDATRILQEQRDVYLQSETFALRNPNQWLLVRPDLQRAWLLDMDRRPLAEFTLDQLRTQMAATWAHATPQGLLPPIQPTGETRTLHGLTCRVHRANARVMVVAACITRQFPALERFSALLGAPADIPGVPLEFQVQVQPPDNQPGFRIRQSLLAVTRERLNPGLLAPPTAATPSGVR
jgi:hypothetical protein